MADRPCPATVDECTACAWRGGNRVGVPCLKCGADVLRRPCRKHCIRGGSVCESHGGDAPQTKAAAARRLAETRARKALDQVDVEPIGDPLAAFADLVAEAEALRKVLAGHVAALGEQLRAEPSKWGAAEQVRAEMAAYERAMDRSGRLLEAWIRVGIDERRLAIESLRLDLDAAVVLGVLTELGLDPDGARVQAALLTTYDRMIEQGRDA